MYAPAGSPTARATGVEGSMKSIGGRRWALWGLVSVSLAALLMVSPALGGTPPPTVPSPPQHWMGSHQSWLNRSGNRSMSRLNVTYNLTAYEGYNESVTATNTSATVTDLQGTWTVVERLNALSCVPNCTNASYSDALSVSAWSSQSQFLNLTTAASVYENGSASPALGILNASALSASHVVASNKVSGPMGASAWQSLNASQASSWNISFSPALGLIPWNASTNLTWNATSHYQMAGAWWDSINASWGGSWGNRTGSTSLLRSSSGSLNRSGNESVWGKDFGNVTGRNNHTTVLIGLHFRGPIRFVGGLLGIAVGSDLFLNATANWTVLTGDGWERADSALTGVWSQHAEALPVAGGSSSGSSVGTGGSTAGSSGGSSVGGGGATAGPTGGTGSSSAPPSGAPGGPTTVSYPTPTIGRSGGPSLSPALLLASALVLVLSGVALAVVLGRRAPRSK